MADPAHGHDCSRTTSKDPTGMLCSSSRLVVVAAAVVVVVVTVVVAWGYQEPWFSWQTQLTGTTAQGRPAKITKK